MTNQDLTSRQWGLQYAVSHQGNITNWLRITAACTLLVTATAQSAEARHRVVFEFVSEGQEQMEAVLSNVENTLEALGPNTEIELVAHSPGLGLLGKHVQFAACENTLRRKKVSYNQLFTGVRAVPSGVAEVVRKQMQQGLLC